MVDADDLNVETQADYDRFSKLAQNEEDRISGDRQLVWGCIAQCEHLRDWEVEFIEFLHRKLEGKDTIGLNDAQRNRVQNILTRLERRENKNE